MDNLISLAKTKVMSAKTYNLIIGVMLLYGFLVNALMCKFGTSLFLSWNPIVVFICYFIFGCIGVFLSKLSDNPILSFVGYNMIVLPLGVVLSICLSDAYSSVILHAFVMTSIITGLMILAAIIKPEFFKSLGGVLFVSLFFVIIVEVILLISGIYTPALLDWIVVLIFCGYIGYDWSVAQEKEYTVDNAIDSALELYLDIINLFIRLFSRNNDD